MEEIFQLCRICISDSSSAVMMSIFGEDGLWQKIQTFANVQIDEGDNLPQQICMMCARNTLNACSFKRKCEESDKFFRSQLLHRKYTKCKDVITISSGETSEEDENDNENVVANSSNHENNVQNLHSSDNANQSQIQTNDDQLPLIPEIELITPNEDDDEDAEKIEEGQIQGYQCSICFEIFAMRSLLSHHMKTLHPETNPSTFQCFNCQKEYLSKRFLEKHIRHGRCVRKRKNQTRPMQCSDCQTLFPSGHHLGWHKRTGCPSKLSLQQLKQLNVTNMQTNLLYRENVLRKMNAANTYKQNHKKLLKPKQKGRSRIKLDAAKIEFARQLVAQDATTSKLALELKISRTFAWRLRKSLLNGFSLQERLPSPQATNNANQSTNLYESNVKSIQENIPIPLLIQNDKDNLNDTTTTTDDDKYLTRQIEITDSDNEDSEHDLTIHKSTNEPQASCSNNMRLNGNDEMKFTIFRTNNDSYQLKKPRKQNVFLDETKYEKAKILVSNNTSTIEIAKQLNVSQMSAWKLRDSIVKNIPLTFRKNSIYKTDEQQLQEQQQQQEHSPTLIGSTSRRDLGAHPVNSRPRISMPETDLHPLQQQQQELLSRKEKLQPSQPYKEKLSNRLRLKTIERYKRDEKITAAILALIKDDKNIQYWKITEHLANLGYSMSPSSVCQKLKSLGIHRRWKTSSSDKKNSSPSPSSMNIALKTSISHNHYPTNTSGNTTNKSSNNSHFLRSTFTD